MNNRICDENPRTERKEIQCDRGSGVIDRATAKLLAEARASVAIMEE